MVEKSFRGMNIQRLECAKLPVGDQCCFLNAFASALMHYFALPLKGPKYYFKYMSKAVQIPPILDLGTPHTSTCDGWRK